MSAARLWFAPGRLSTTTCCPHAGVSPLAMVRAIRSGDPPGGSGTTKRTGREGNGCASAGAVIPRQKAEVRRQKKNLICRQSSVVSHQSSVVTLLQRDIDVFRLREREQLVVALLAADARLLVAAERDADVVRPGAVHPDEAGLDACGSAVRVGEARRPDRAGEAVLDRVD